MPHKNSRVPDQTAQKCWLIWAFASCKCPKAHRLIALFNLFVLNMYSWFFLCHHLGVLVQESFFLNIQYSKEICSTCIIQTQQAHVHATSWRCIDINATLHQHHVTAGKFKSFHHCKFRVEILVMYIYFLSQATRFQNARHWQSMWPTLRVCL